MADLAGLAVPHVRRRDARRRLSGAVALQHGNAEQLPSARESGIERRAARNQQRQSAAETAVYAPKQETPCVKRKARGYALRALPPRPVPAPVYLALDRPHEQLQRLRDGQERGDLLPRQGAEDHRRLAAERIE